MDQVVCTCCGAADGEIFYEVERTPANSCLLIDSRQEALAFPCGTLRLAFCPRCGFVWNTAFAPELTEYSAKYEETQGFSPTFNRFHRQLALDLIERYDLRGKRIIEVGCGKGEFLALLCELGDNTGVGFDPVYVEGRLRSPAAGRMTFIKDLYSEKYAGYAADFLCCKMTLEHIAEPAAFVKMLRRTLGNARETILFFQVPDAGRVIGEGAMEDFYYEHCSYFSRASLGRLFQAGGFEVLAVDSVYDGQYLILEARPGAGDGEQRGFAEELAEIEAAVRRFRTRCEENRRFWRSRLEGWAAEGKKVAVWGSGSKAVGFLTAVQVPDAVDCVVDINPHKAGSFAAGTGHPIVLPETLSEVRPEVVVIMNAIYREEIATDLHRLGLDPLLLTLRPEAASGENTGLADRTTARSGRR